MKRLLIPISIIAASFYFGSCNDLKIGDDFLEKAPGADVTLDTIFASKQYAERALAFTLWGYVQLGPCRRQTGSGSA